MRKENYTALALTASILAGCGSGVDPERMALAESGLESVENAYGCLVGVEIEFVEDMQSEELYELYGDAAFLRGFVNEDDDTVYLNSELFDDEVEVTAAHESIHACTDSSVDRPLEAPVELPGDNGTLVASRGFTAIFNLGNEEWTNGSIEEGVVTFLHRNLYPNEFVDGGGGYETASNLVFEIASLRGFEPEELAKMHYEDDLEGFISVVHGKEIEDVTPQDVLDVFLMFDAAMYLDFEGLDYYRNIIMLEDQPRKST